MSTRRSARTRATSRTPPSIDAYLATLDDERRALLARLRRTIRAALPGAVECFSYGMPAFRSGGRVVAGFQATARGGSFYPFSGSTPSATRSTPSAGRSRHSTSTRRGRSRPRWSR